jgi:hypothetical protein
MRKYHFLALGLILLLQISAQAEIKVTSLACQTATHAQLDLNGNQVDLSPRTKQSSEEVMFFDESAQKIWLKRSEQGTYIVNAATNKGTLLSKYHDDFVFGDAPGYGDNSALALILEKSIFILKQKTGAIVSSFAVTRPIDYLKLVTRDVEKNGVHQTSKIAVVVSGKEVLTVRADENPKKLFSATFSESPASVLVMPVTNARAKTWDYSSVTNALYAREENVVRATFKDGKKEELPLGENGTLFYSTDPAPVMLSPGRNISPGNYAAEITSVGTELRITDKYGEWARVDFKKPIRFARNLSQQLANVGADNVLVAIDGNEPQTYQLILLNYSSGNPKMMDWIPITESEPTVRFGSFRSAGSPQDEFGVDLLRKKGDPIRFRYDWKHEFTYGPTEELSHPETIELGQ